MNNTIIFLSILIVLLSIMLDIKLSLYLDIYSKDILVEIRLYSIKIITIKLDIFGLFYEVNNSKKSKDILDIFSKENNYFFKEIKKSILDKLYYGEINIDLVVGARVSSDTAIIGGSIFQLFNAIDSILSSRDIDFRYSINPDYLKYNLKLKADIRVYFTIFDMVFAVILSLYKRSRYVRKIQKQRG